MSAEILIWDGVTKHDLPCDRVLQSAIEAGVTEVVICGFGKDGEFYFASNKADAGDVIYHLEMAKKKLLDICDR